MPRKDKAANVEYMRKRRAAAPEKVRALEKAAKRKWRAENPHKAQEQVQAERLRRAGMIFAPGQTVASMLEQQAGLCAICKMQLPIGKLRHVDHCHVSGRVRGLLCHKCNVGLGMFSDNAEKVAAALRYLKDFETSLPSDTHSPTRATDTSGK
jgi:hypothetical protein